MSRRISSFIPAFVAPLTLVCSPGYAENIQMTPSPVVHEGAAAYYQTLSASFGAVSHQQKSAALEPRLLMDAQGRTISGEPALVVVKNAAGVTVGSGIVNTDGTFNIELSPPQRDGAELTVTLMDATENVSMPAAVSAPDLTPPAAAHNVFFPGDGSSISGNGTPYLTVEIRDRNGDAIADGVVREDGSFLISLHPALRNGEAVDVVLINAAGQESVPVLAISPDLTAPDAPRNLLVNATGTLLRGTGEVGTTVTVRNAANQIVGTDIVQSDGSFSVTLSPRQGDSGLLSVTLTDSAGNTSVAGTVHSPDLIPPGMPRHLVVNASGSRLTGNGEAGTTVTVRDAGNQLVGLGPMLPDGSFSVTLTPPQLNGGLLSVTLTDINGNHSMPGHVAAPDVDGPDRASNLRIDAAGTTVTGDGERGAVVSISDANDRLVGVSMVDSNGHFVVTLTPPLRDGGVLRVTLTNDAGHTSAPSFLQTSTSPSLRSTSVNHAADANVTTAQLASHPVGFLLTSGAEDAYQVASYGHTVHRAIPASLQAASSPALSDPPANLQIDAQGRFLTGTRVPGGMVRVTSSSGSGIGEVQENRDGSFTITLAPRQFSGDTLTVAMTKADGAPLPGKHIQSPTFLVKAGAPTITSVASGNQSAQITYTPASTNEHSPITGFIAKAYQDDAIVGQASCDVDATAPLPIEACPLTVNGLTNGQEYQFVVSASHAQEEGEASAPQTAAVIWAELVSAEGAIPGMSGSATAQLSGGGALCSFQGHSGFGPAAQQPDNTTVPHGQFQFTASPCPGTLTITLNYPEPLPEGIRFRKSDGQGAWFDPQDSATSLNLSLSENRRVVTYQITDDGLGDSAAQTPNLIVDPLVPVVVNSQPNGPEAPHSIPVFNAWGLAALSALTALLGRSMVLRRSRRSTPRHRA